MQQIIRKARKIRSPLKTHGGKNYLAQWIISLFPEGYEKLTYIEPFIGGGSVFLNKKPSCIEIIGDLDVGTYQVYTHLKYSEYAQKFIDRLSALTYSEETFLAEKEKEQRLRKRHERIASHDIDLAVNEFVLRRMSRGGLKKSFAWSKRERGGEPGDVHAWKTILKELPIISKRLSNVYVHWLDAYTNIVINAGDPTSLLIYCDPPYLHETRTSKEAYYHEMTVREHTYLLDCLVSLKDEKIIISGYPSELYNEKLKGWRVEKKEIVNHSSQKKKKETKTEVCWMNY